jgi:hypothetical protein
VYSGVITHVKLYPHKWSIQGFVDLEEKKTICVDIVQTNRVNKEGGAGVR